MEEYVVRLSETHDTPISALKLEFYNGKVQPCKLTILQFANTHSANLNYTICTNL